MLWLTFQCPALCLNVSLLKWPPAFQFIFKFKFKSSHYKDFLKPHWQQINRHVQNSRYFYCSSINSIQRCLFFDAESRDWTEHECEVRIQDHTYVRTYHPNRTRVLLAQGTHPKYVAARFARSNKPLSQSCAEQSKSFAGCYNPWLQYWSVFVYPLSLIIDLFTFTFTFCVGEYAECGFDQQRLVWYVCRLWDMVFSWRFER